LTTNDDDFPYRSNDPDLQPAPYQPASRKSASQYEFDDSVRQDIKMLLRLLVGSAAEGSDEFTRRARLWQAEMDRLDRSTGIIPIEEETEATRLRYTLFGFLFQAVDAGHDSLLLFDKIAGKTIDTFAFLFYPLIRSRLMRPVRDRFAAYYEEGEAVVDSWLQTGRREEAASRYLVRKEAYEGIINDTIEYLANKPEVGDLIQSQSIGMAEEILNDVRGRSSDYDAELEERVKRLFRRQRPK
jgi:hypothetical protein